MTDSEPGLPRLEAKTAVSPAGASVVHGQDGAFGKFDRWSRTGPSLRRCRALFDAGNVVYEKPGFEREDQTVTQVWAFCVLHPARLEGAAQAKQPAVAVAIAGAPSVA